MNSVIDDREEPERPSKSQRKRDMAALQDLGTELVMLNADQLAQIELPERLHEAIADAQRIRDFEGRRRQMQFIGKLMREIDPAPIRAKLDEWSGVARAGTAQQRLVERWRERLLADDTALDAVCRRICGLRPSASAVADREHQARSRAQPHAQEFPRAVPRAARDCRCKNVRRRGRA